MKEKKTKLERALSEVRDTVHGKMNIPKLVEREGEPSAVMEFATIEARTGLAGSSSTIKVDRYVDGKLVFPSGIQWRGIPKSLILKMPYNGIRKEKVRHPNYDSGNPPKATKAEILKVTSQKK